jgi:phosphoribosyl 1,2-cyclic phosphodiesterase
MKVVIWGSRGSLPASVPQEMIRSKIYRALELSQGHDLRTKEEIENFIDTLPFSVRGGYGTNTPCVEIRDDDLEDFIIFDAGTGIRDFGNYAMKLGKGNSRFHIFMSHLHWDHIHGFPFFVPAYIEGNIIDFYGYHEGIEEAFVEQQEAPCFPVSLNYMQATKRFHQLDVDTKYLIAGLGICGFEQYHPGKSYGYCILKDGKKIVYSTDSENREDSFSENYQLLDFYQDADLLILDTQYSLQESLYSKRDWGHSSNVKGVDLAVRAGVKHLCMFHSEPTHSDEVLDDILEKTLEFAKIYAQFYPLEISLAYDGLEIEV